MTKKKALYSIENNEEICFSVTNYNFAKPFTNFFPGIAGTMGIPLWCFYVNRGQCITSFGTKDKDGAILEFQPANKAYWLTALTGFRTFIKIHKGSNTLFYEPFRDDFLHNDFDIEKKMSLSPYDLKIVEKNRTLGITIEVHYFTVPEEPIAALARKVIVKNESNEELSLELLDGLPHINPFGISNFALKEMSRTAEAWTFVENMHMGVPFYHVKTLMDDVSEVTEETRGNFYLSFMDNNGIQMCRPIIDPRLVFGMSTDLSFPYAFFEGMSIPEVQNYENRTPSAFAYYTCTIHAHDHCDIYSLVGHAHSVNDLNARIDHFSRVQFFLNKEEKNKYIIKNIMNTSFIHSGSEKLNAYVQQNFLDNSLRGGFPLSIKSKNKRDVFYLYSRKHGDPERDYNNFELSPSYFSQGNGNFRDINQNRRNDVWYNPDVGFSNIHYFANLQQLDGYNPLVVKGLQYHFVMNDENKENIARLVHKESFDSLIELLGKTFLPHDLINFYQNNRFSHETSMFDFISEIIACSEKEEVASHGEGYWTDHWFYLIDLIESYASIYPDHMDQLLFDMKIFSFYDDAYFVVPVSEKHLLHGEEPRQYNAVTFSEEKQEMIEDRENEKNRARTNNGKGEVCRTTLAVKLFLLTVIKSASLDASGQGIEMESDKPGWNDSLNGLPGIFGSSLSETFQLKRLLLLFQSWLLPHSNNQREIALPVELHSLYKKIDEKLQSLLSGKINTHQYWESSVSAKEEYRKKIFFGLSGKEKELSFQSMADFFKKVLEIIDRGIGNSLNKETGLYNTYYINKANDFTVQEREKRQKLKEKNIKTFVKIHSFKHEPLPLFLEAQMHALSIERDSNRAGELHRRVKGSDLYDEKLGMYKVNASLASCSYEIGRARTFTPGWLENESIFLHLHYKYLLSLLKSGLIDEFYTEIKTGLVPFMDPEVYGRSVFENSSFISSSANPDERLLGTGYSARLSGSTAEMNHMMLFLAFGKAPFTCNEDGQLQLCFTPSLAGWLFTKEEKSVTCYVESGASIYSFAKGTFSINFLGNILVVYHNSFGKNTFGDNSAVIKEITLTDHAGNKKTIVGNTITGKDAEMVRSKGYKRIDIFLT